MSEDYEPDEELSDEDIEMNGMVIYTEKKIDFEMNGFGYINLTKINNNNKLCKWLKKSSTKYLILYLSEKYEEPIQKKIGESGCEYKKIIYWGTYELCITYCQWLGFESYIQCLNWFKCKNWISRYLSMDDISEYTKNQGLNCLYFMEFNIDNKYNNNKPYIYVKIGKSSSLSSRILSHNSNPKFIDNKFLKIISVENRNILDKVEKSILKFCVSKGVIFKYYNYQECIKCSPEFLLDIYKEVDKILCMFRRELFVSHENYMKNKLIELYKSKEIHYNTFNKLITM